MFDLCSIGNALVDIIISTDDAFLRANSITKGAMVLVGDDRSAALYERAGAAIEMSSGGSAANTMAGFSSLGGTGAFLGKVGRDRFGAIFTHDLRAQDIDFATKPSPDLPSGRCLIFVTPDAQRSMNTTLGAAAEFGPDDVEASVVQNAEITYLEGYLFDKPKAQQAFLYATRLAREAGRKRALTLSDVFCVSRHRKAFLELIAGEIDILFANENEIRELYETQDLQAALHAARAHADIAIVTRGAQGAIIAAGTNTYEVPAYPVAEIVDTTGAGDLFAAGFLYGLTHGKSLPACGHIGAIAAAEVISHFGPRPQKKLRDLISKSADSGSSP
ncbi:MAG: adenosine kinase [Alphaproteobacteria bacterium]|nr:adenosine kinase [Alphaproteobacteria bacterium]